MRTISARDAEAVSEAANVLQAGGVILYPTDTQYGLGADALSNKTVEKVYAIKSREAWKPIHCIVADLGMAKMYGEFDDIALLLAREFLPGALTLIVRKKEDINSGIARGNETIGIRIPKHDFCLALAKEFGGPYTTTSANISGQRTERNVSAILKQLSHNSYSSVLPARRSLGAGGQKTAIENIGLVIDAGELPESEPSTVVDVSQAEPIIVREGAIPAAEIWDAIRVSR